MKSEVYRTRSHVGMSGMPHVLALNSPDDYSHISGNRRLEFLSTINIFLFRLNNMNLQNCIFSKIAILFLTLSVFSCSTVPLKQAQKAHDNREMKFLYQERYPGEKVRYNFISKKNCPMRIKQFESEEHYRSVESKKLTSVRIIHIYATSYHRECKKMSNQVLDKKLILPVEKKRMTHVYLTYDADIQIMSNNAVGIYPISRAQSRHSPRRQDLWRDNR